MDDVGKRGPMVAARLSAMMALIYAVQGAWWPLLAVHLKDLGISGRGQGWIFATLAIASVATPLGMGHLVDRRWPTQKVLAAIFGLGTLVLAVVAAGPTRQAGGLFLLLLGYWLLTAPAFGLAASLAFRNLDRPGAQFGKIRLWGTVGWMVVGWIAAGVMATSGGSGGGAAPAFWVGAVLSAIMGAYCLTLPHTPPLAGRVTSNAPDEGRAILRRPAMRTYLIAAFAVCLTTPYMYQILPPYLRERGISRAGIPLVMTLGQVPEILALAFLPRLMGRFGYRGTLALGIGAWALRFGSLAFDPPLWVALAGITLHGVAVASFHIGGQLFLDSQAPPDRRASFQGLYVLVTSGIGPLLGNVMAGELAGAFRGQYGLIFLVPTLIDLAALAIFLVGFHPERADAQAPAPAAECPRALPTAVTG